MDGWTFPLSSELVKAVVGIKLNRFYQGFAYSSEATVLFKGLCKILQLFMCPFVK